jgi:ElaB/YqjD/DUF883 family membrane-anchored ribosome-binding protein
MNSATTSSEKIT